MFGIRTGIGIGIGRQWALLNRKPLITLPSSIPVSDTELTVLGTIDNGKLPTIWSVQYGLNDTLGSEVPGGTITNTAIITKSLTGLSAYTRYYWRLKAVNAKGTSFSATLFSATSIELGFVSNQLDTNVNLLIDNLDVAAGKSAIVNYGDGTQVTLTGVNTNITKTYSSLGTFLVKFSGDINSITKFILKNQSRVVADISNWPLSSSASEISFVSMPNLSCDLNKWTLPSTLRTNVILTCTKFSGNPFKNGYPPLLNVINYQDSTAIDGDLSNVNLPLIASGISILCPQCKFVGVFRGNLKYVTVLNFSQNRLSISALSNFLEYMDGFFTGGIIPSVNIVVTLNGAGNDTPVNMSDNVHLLSIKAKYVAVGKTATISVNNYTVAYSDQDSKIRIPLTTYLGGENEVVHPSVVNIGAQWNGYQYWMANTPMPQEYENPSIWASNDGDNWVVPAGITNPVVQRPPGSVLLNFNNDPNLFFENGRLYLTWNSVINGFSFMNMMSTLDTITWTDKIVIVDGNDDQGDHNGGAAPSLVKIDGVYYIYYVSADPENFHIRRRSCVTIDGYYSNAQNITLPKLAGRGWWHLHVFNKDGVIWFMGNTTTGDNTNSWGPYIILAKSTDGLTFTRDSDALPTIGSTESWELTGALYRPSMMLISDTPYIYYSFKNSRNFWETARIRVYLL